MKILITGGAGYIGMVLTSHLLRQGHEVTVYDNFLFGGEGLLAFSGYHFRRAHGDITNGDVFLRSLEGMDAVVHLAALVGEAACAIDQDATQDVNLRGVYLAFSLAQKANVDRFIFISTCSNYGISKPNSLTDENAPLHPLTDYAVAKVAAEQKILESSASMISTILRFGTICGLSPRMRFDLLVNEIARSSALNLPIQIFSPEAWRPFLHIQDAARAIECCLMAPPEYVNNGIFNVVSENCQKADLVKLVHKHYPSKDVEIVEKAVDARDYRVSAERIQQMLGFSPCFTIEQAFLEVVQAVEDQLFLDPMSQRHTAIPNLNTQLAMV